MAEPIRISDSEQARSSRLQRRVEDLLDRAEQAADAGDWAAARSSAREALLIDEANHDAASCSAPQRPCSRNPAPL